jgi:putative hydrolase of the HAD superfamily
MDKVILWDFDGTLARREGLWRSALMQALDRHEPGHGIAPENLRGLLRDGFPWHEPERPHPELCEPEKWWARIEGLLARAFRAVGIAEDRAPQLARAARYAFIDPATCRLFDDTCPVLEELADLGWRHLILSNHVPELEDIVAGLGVRHCFDAVLTSALTGYEKPHPEAFRLALGAAGQPEEVWMVGDNPEADVAGAERVGIPAILVRREGEARRKAADLWGVLRIVGGSAAP